MACIKCKKKKEGIRFPYLPGEVCAECFVEIVEKRVRRDVRLNRHFCDAKKILVLDDGSENAAACRYFIKELNEYSKIRFVSRKISSVNELSGKEIARMMKERKADKVILPWNANQESEFLLKSMISKKGFLRDDTRIIKLLKHLSQKEAEIFAKIKGLDFKMKSEPYDSETGRFLDKLERDSPDIRFALVRSFEKIRD